MQLVPGSDTIKDLTLSSGMVRSHFPPAAWRPGFWKVDSAVVGGDRVIGRLSFGPVEQNFVYLYLLTLQYSYK